MDMIELAREIGRQLQKDERYLNMRAVSAQCDKDEELQELIGEFNLKRIAISNETQSDTRDDEKLRRLNGEMRHIMRIMQNENMTAYNRAKEEMDHLLQRISAIISQSADGEDPNTADYVESAVGIVLLAADATDPAGDRRT